MPGAFAIPLRGGLIQRMNWSQGSFRQARPTTFNSGGLRARLPSSGRARVRVPHAPAKATSLVLEQKPHPLDRERSLHLQGEQ
jgi:hypothetical protein